MKIAAHRACESGLGHRENEGKEGDLDETDNEEHSCQSGCRKPARGLVRPRHGLDGEMRENEGGNHESKAVNAGHHRIEEHQQARHGEDSGESRCKGPPAQTRQVDRQGRGDDQEQTPERRCHAEAEQQRADEGRDHRHQGNERVERGCLVLHGQGRRLLCDVGQQREIACALDRLGEFALFLGRDGGDA